MLASQPTTKGRLIQSGCAQYHLDGTIERYKTSLVAKGYRQAYGLIFSKFFSYNKAGNHPIDHFLWPYSMIGLSINLMSRMILYGNLEETVYMQQPPRFELQEEC